MIHNHSCYSFKYGILNPQEILEMALLKGFDTILLADINNTSIALDFIRRATKIGIKPVLGIDFRNRNEKKYVGIAMTNKGFQEMNTFLSEYLHNGNPFPDIAPKIEDAQWIYHFGKEPSFLKENEWVGITQEDLTKIPLSKYASNQSRLLAFPSSTFRNKRDFNTHRLLRAIHNNVLLSQLPKSEEGKIEDCFNSKNELIKIYSSYPDFLKRTERLLSKSKVSFCFASEGTHHNLKNYTKSKEKDFKLLKKLVYNGLSYRYKDISDLLLDRIDKELKVIKEKDFVCYFLVAWRMVKYARNKNYFYVGRGSGANSVVAYLLRITDVDPIELDLYFERFINLFRTSPPDFDIDFSWLERNDVTQFLFDRFENVALLATYNTFQYKSTIRELGKVFGLPDFEIKKLQERNQASDEIGSLVLRYSHYIHGLPSHLSVHSGGIIISDKPIHCFSATEIPPKGFPIAQFDMYAAEDIGLYKFDVLGQRGLAKIKEALEIIKYNRGEEVDIHNVKKIKQDPISNGLLEKGCAIACFYVESPAMRMLLKKLKVNNYLGLVAASSVIRPGVSQSGMMQEYILRFRDENQRKRAQEETPDLYNLMPETFGVMVYQEDVIKVAHSFAGLTLAEADVLRRGMSGKFRSREEFVRVQDKFFKNCKEKGYDRLYVEEIWRQIESFAGYAFAKGHSASYAVESYQCLYLKAYYPLEYLVATVNNGGGFYSTELYLHEARQNGADIHLPCVNKSYSQFVIYGKSIFIALSRIRGLERVSIENLLAERTKGLFKSFRDFVKRVDISLDQLILLIRSGAFDFCGKGKKELLWDAHYLKCKNSVKKKTLMLFDSKEKDITLPDLWEHPFEDAFDELELIGFTVKRTPFTMLTSPLDNKMCIRHFDHFLGRKMIIIGYLIHVKRTYTKYKERMCFGTFIDQEGQWMDSVHFPQVMVEYPFRGPGCYELTGKVIEEFGYFSLEVTKMRKLEMISLE